MYHPMARSTHEIEEEIRRLEEEIRNTQYNKATQYHIGKLKAKIARLRAEMEKAGSKKGGGRGYAVRKSGDGTVALVGFPSVGKSTLLNALTDAKSEVGSYEFTTLDVIPGIMYHGGAEIQIFDLPGLIEGAHRGRGRGREVISSIRGSDILLILTDVYNHEIDTILHEIYQGGIRLNTSPPHIKIERTAKGGIEIYSTVSLTKLDDRMIRTVLNENGIVNAKVVLRGDYGIEELIDVVMGNRVYMNGIIALNKIDLISGDEVKAIANEMERRHGMPVFPISAERGIGIEDLKDGIFRALSFIRIYMKPQGREADYSEPMIVHKGTTIEDVCRRIHRSFLERFRFARVWGKSVRFPGQRVGLEHVVEDGDVISIIVRKE